MHKPTVYLDTNIFSAYWHESSDVSAAARRLHTREWWAQERHHFSLRVSITTINELHAGSFRRQADCVKMARAVPRLAMTQSTKNVLNELLKSRLIPETKPGDALQMAVSTAHEIDYLLTWNYAHLANDPASEIRANHTQENVKMKDIIVEEVRRVREELIGRYGGIDGYFKHCQAQERVQSARPKSRRRKQATRTTRKTIKST